MREQGGALLLQVIDKIAAGTAVAEPQDNEQATYATLLDRRWCRNPFRTPRRG